MPDRSSLLTGLSSRNWGLKTLALLLALLTYYAIRGATGYEVEYAIPVRVESEPGIAVLAQDTDTVKVRFRGSQDDLLKLDQRHLRAVIRTRGENPDGMPRTIEIMPRDIEGAPGIAIVKIDPAFIALTFDREIETTFSVTKPAMLGRPLIGKAEIAYTPQTVTIRGPKRRLEELKLEGRDAVTTEPVDVDGRVESFSKRVGVRPPGGTWVTAIVPDEVTVQIEIVKASASREWKALRVLALRGGTDSTDVFIEPALVDVIVDGRAEVVEHIAATDILVFVDCMGLDRSASYELPVQVHLPVYDDVTTRIVPKTVTVSFQMRSALEDRRHGNQ